MPRAVYDLQGFSIVLEKINFITRVFEAENNEGWQFSVRFSSDVRIRPTFASRSDAELQRSLLIKALKEC